MMQKIYKFFKEKKEKGQSIIEYGILIAIIVTAVLTVRNTTKLDDDLTALANEVHNNMTAATNAAKHSGPTGSGS